VRSATRATLATPARPRAGRRIVLRLTLSAPAGTRAVPSGTVVWKVDGRTVCRTSLASGRASCRTRRLKAGRHTVVATYAGSSAFTPVTVRKAVKVRR
jgi:hypothetical protein